MKQISARVIDLALRIQGIPAPTFSEGRRAEFVRDLFRKEELEQVSTDELGNVFGLLRGKNITRKPLVVSAHVDTVFPEDVDLQSREEPGKIFGPGIGDNSLGVAALMGIVWALREMKVELLHDLWLVANVGEEGLGDLRGMNKLVDGFGDDVLGYLILEGLALGHIYHKAVAVKRFRIHVHTAGGHSWSDYGQPSAVHELAALITSLTSLRLPREPRTTINVGTISGGTGVNVLASEASCELDLRSEDPMALKAVTAQVEEIFRKANKKGVEIEAEVIGQRLAGDIPAGHPFVQWAITCTKKAGVEAVLISGSTDANVPLSRGIPAIVMGVTSGGGAHTTHEYIDTEPVTKGMESIVRFVSEIGAKAVVPDRN